MDGIKIQLIFRLLGGFLSLYSLLIVIRIMLTWFSHVPSAKPVEILARITDPYLNWWRGKLGLRIGFLDLSPLAGIVALSAAQTVCSLIARQGKISPMIILAVCLSAVWSAVSFLLIFCIIILVLRIIGYFTNANIYSPFWKVVDAVSRTLLYRVNRIIFGKRIVGYKIGIISAVAVFAALWIGGRFAVGFVTGLLLRM